MSDSNKKVLVVGELCTDEHVYCTVNRMSPEAPVPVADIELVMKKDGMAGNVANNLRAFGIDLDFVHNSPREYITKRRYVDTKSGQHLMRADSMHPNIQPLDISSLKEINDLYSTIVISDYNKGFIEYSTVKRLRREFKGPIFIDSKKNDLGQFEGCTVKVNESEYNKATSLPQSLIVTKGDKGALYQDHLYPAVRSDMFDVCGAGDTFLAGLVHRHLKGDEMGACIEFANKCAAIAVQHRGTYTLNRFDIESIT